MLSLWIPPSVASHHSYYVFLYICVCAPCFPSNPSSSSTTAFSASYIRFLFASGSSDTRLIIAEENSSTLAGGNCRISRLNHEISHASARSVCLVRGRPDLTLGAIADWADRHVAPTKQLQMLCHICAGGAGRGGAGVDARCVN
ncbi:uncharacterized protein LOC114748492 [Neltuma alba]|uniref:uncharacterized protein LOC114748492 n=1 Tax=Neltuma alba TaxID=207710 RepID=UPI0010A47E1C|nr:uncharacterized protein LOC114748492 [Prosopis alba]